MRQLVVVGLAAMVLVTPAAAPTPAAPGAGDGHADGERAGVEELERIVEASRQAAYQGRVVLASFSERGPAVSEIGITQGGGGELRVTRGETWELGRVEGEGYLRSSPDTLLRLSGVERTPFELERLLVKYVPRRGGVHELDTGPATLVELRDRSSGTLRERLYTDGDTGLVVRRETYDREGAPVRIMAFTRLDPQDVPVERPDDGELEVERRALNPADTEGLRDDGFLVPEELPAGYGLVEGRVVDDAAVPTLNLVYSDGLYVLSLYQQQGRLATSAVDGAARLTTDDGGHVWRWPGSEPRRVVWTGDRLTFTALTDAPTDELLTVASGLPTSGSPSILDRLSRGLSRVGDWLTPMNRSN